ncbi:sarcosine oxidase subunit gamma [Dinoroseobacter sp. S375]|uniref:sarcosine oxidase subunit gamma n=1 Tax=Dinoroseobacter sp. S375 TaxID=3415136 RepID=UPI003C797E64
MSEPYAPQIAEVTGLGMITIRADLGAAETTAVFEHALGLAAPAPRQITQAAELALAWMSPDEAMLFCPRAEVGARVTALTEGFGDAFATCVDVSDARRVYEVSGPGARECLAKLTPAPMAPERFGMGEMRRTRLAQVATALWMPAPDRVRLICFRSVAQYVEDLLAVSAAPGGALRLFAE